jgi:voltage-gated potassium channel Kch
MLNDWIERRASHAAARGLDGPEKGGVASAIVVGYGRFGQTVAQMLMAKGIAVTLIDSKPSQIEISGDFGMKVYYGDGLRIDLLRMAGADEARGIFFCIDGRQPDKRRLEAILEAFPQAAVHVRLFDRLHHIEVDELDLAGSVREIWESAVAMGREALRLFGASDEEVERIEQEYRQRDLERLESQAASGDLHALQERMFGPDNPLEKRA